MKKGFFVLLSLFISSFIFAQSADFVTKIIDAPEATYGQVCYLIAVYQELIPETASETDALNAIFEEGELPENVGVNSPINYQQAAFYMAKLWKIKGSLMFTISNKSPRYAYKQLKLDGIINSKADPSFIPSGREILNMFTRGSTKYDGALTAAQE